jgi:sugar O-acyltransferase (sialic acid O-acetyltransferase NeuD family)
METASKSLIIIGDSAFAEIAFEYFSVDTDYTVVAFAVERTYLTKRELFGLPVVAFEDLADLYAPERHAFFAALVYTEGNRLRARLYRTAKEMGFEPASYVSPRAFVWRNAVIGEHVFVFEDNVIQPFVRIGDNVVLWSGNHIGHHSSIGADTFVSSHVVVSGFVNVGASSFLGVNSTMVNNISVGDDCILGAGALVLRDVPPGTTVVGTWHGLPSGDGVPG